MEQLTKQPTPQQKRYRFYHIAVSIILLLIIANLFVLLRPALKPLYFWIEEVTLPFLAGLIIAYLLHPIVASLEKRRVPRLAALLLIYMGFVLLVVVAVMNAIPIFTKQMVELSDDLPRLTTWYETWMQEWEAHKYFLPDSIQHGVDRAIIQSQEKMTHDISSFVDGAKKTLGKVLGYAVIPFIAFYLLKDMKQIHRGLILWVPRKFRRQTQVAMRDINDSLGKYIHGQMVVSLIVGVLIYIGYWAIKMPYPFVLACFVALTNIIPFIGPLIGAVPALLIALTISTKQVLLVLGINLAIQIIEGNIISPNIMGKTLHLHPLTIIFALLAGEAIAGVIGMILAVPVLAVLKVIIQRIILIRTQS